MTRLLIVYQSKPAIVPGLAKGFKNSGVEIITFLADQHHHWVDKYVFHTINKWAHNLRLLKKGKFLFSGHPLNHWNYLNAELVKYYKNNKYIFITFYIFNYFIYYFLHELVYTLSKEKKSNKIKFN